MKSSVSPTRLAAARFQQASQDVPRFAIGMLSQDVGGSLARIQEFEHPAQAQTPNSRPTAALFGIEGDPGERLGHAGTFAQPSHEEFGAKRSRLQAVACLRTSL